MRRTILGARIRERRRSLGITQASLAREVGISASYLNLIEANKRSIAGSLLRSVANALQTPIEELDNQAELRLVVDLREIAGMPEAGELGVESANVAEFIGRFPGWAKACVALYRSERAAVARERALTDRMRHDPFLGNTVHAMLTQTSAVRSAAEILTQYEDIGPEDRRRFQAIIQEQSVLLTEVGESLAAYFDKDDSPGRVLTPLDEVEAMFQARSNHIEEIEAAAEKLAPGLTGSAERSRIEQARLTADRDLGGLVNDLLSREPRIHTVLAARQARAALLEYAAAALVAPMSAFAPRAQQLRYDVEALSQAFSMRFETACLRLIALPAAEGRPRFGYLKANASGTIVQSRSLPELGAPRYDSACPLWVLFRAQQSPEAVLRQRVIFATGTRFVFVARARNTGVIGFGKARHYVTDMLAMSEGDAAFTVYAPEADTPVEPVGQACRCCPRRECVHRVADPLAG